MFPFRRCAYRRKRYRTFRYSPRYARRVADFTCWRCGHHCTYRYVRRCNHCLRYLCPVCRACKPGCDHGVLTPSAEREPAYVC